MNSLFTRVSLVIAFLAVGFGVNAQSISSDLNNRTGVQETIQEDFVVSVAAGTLFGQSGALRFTLATPAQASNINLSVQNPLDQSWNQIVLDGSGVGEVALPLIVNVNFNARVTFDAPGTYNYSLSIINSSNVVATNSNESVVVSALSLAAPTVSSTLNGESLNVGSEFPFTVTTVANDYENTPVRGFFKLNNPAQATNTNLTYEAAPGVFLPLSIDANGIGYFGPVTGFPLANVSTNFKAIFYAAGIYGYKIAIYDVATLDTLAFVNESVTVGTLPTIESDLNGTTVFTGDVTEFEISTVANSYIGVQTLVYFEALDAALIPNVSIEVLQGGNWYPVDITSGSSTFPAFPLVSDSQNLRVTFDAPGTYPFKLSLVETASNDTLASSLETVTVINRALPTIGSDLDGLTVTTDATTEFEISTEANDYTGTQTLVYFEALDLQLVPNVTIEASVGGNWVLVDISSGNSTFPPFSLVTGSENFRVTFDEAGTYPFKLSLVNVANDDTLASSLETVTVVDPAPVAALISSNLDGRTGVEVNEEETFIITTVANDFANENVRIKITLETPAQAPNFFITQNSATIAFDANGVAYIGAVGGFPLDDETFDLEVSFLAGGTFAYKIALIDVSDNSVLAETYEEVFVLDNSSIANNASFISNTFPNPTEGIVHIQTTETGIGTLGVYTLTGQKVIDQTINGSASSVSLETLPSGMYIIKISQNEKDAVIRVVKK